MTDLKLNNGHLWVAGAFSNIANSNQRALATLNPTTGRLQTFFSGALAGVHNGGVTTVIKMDITPSGDRLVAVGNFDTLNGVKKHQILVLNTSGATATAADFNTTFYQQACSASFQSYMRDVDISPDGSFAAVSTTGAYGGAGTACDSVSRWETHAEGADVRPSWVNNTGGDTTYAIEVTDTVVYTGGHARWQNNPFRADVAGQGAVARPGIAALDPINGLPLSWNPTRTRGVGVFDFLHTADGLWVGSDTDRIGDFYLRGRIALLPHQDGTIIPAIKSAKLPNDVYMAHPLAAPPGPVTSFRVNAGGPEIAETPVTWQSDATGNGFHNAGLTRNTYAAAVGSLDASVPAGTPSSIFSTELTGNATTRDITWNIPTTAGQSLDVRLYFANRSSATASVGQRRFHIDLEGTRVQANFDVVAAVGNNKGMMRSYKIPSSDSNLDLDLARSGNSNFPMISAVEIVSTDPTPEPAQPVLKRSYDGTTAGADSVVDPGGRNWNSVRGAFMLNGYLYTGWSDGTFVKQTFDGTTYGAPVLVNTHDLLAPLVDWQNDIKTATSMFYDQGRIYFTLAGDNRLLYRFFTAESDVVGAQRLVAATGAAAGVDFTQVRGAFAVGTKFYYANATGALVRTDWAQNAPSGAPVPGTATTVSGPAIDAKSWSARALFLFQGPDGGGAVLPPTASFTFDCSNLTCAFDATGSTAPNATITGYAWDFGDGTTGSGATVSHLYPGTGTRTVTLTVSTNKGGVANTSQDVTVTQVNQAPDAAFTKLCDQLACSFDASSSSDPDGDTLSYNWAFGDGSTDIVSNPSHSYPANGSYPVTLTVSDGSLSDDASASVDVVQAAVEYVASASTARNSTSHIVTVPASVKAGDTLLLFLTTNLSTTTINPLAGWTSAQTVDGNGVLGRVWTRTATAGDAGTVTTVTTSAATKSTMTVSAYRNQAGPVSVTASAGAKNDSSVTSVKTPSVQVDDARAWVVSYWAEKSSVEPLTWTAPAGVEVRSGAAATGMGKVSSLVADSGAPVGAGTAGNLTATPSGAASRAVAFSVVIAPQ